MNDAREETKRPGDKQASAMNRNSWRLPPVYIEILMNIHGRREPYGHADAPILREAVKDFLLHEIIEDSGDYPRYTLTRRGRALVDMICNTPLPALVFVDPRTEAILMG